MNSSCKITDSAGQVVFNSLSAGEEALFLAGSFGVVSFGGGRARLGQISGEKGSVFLLSRDPDLIKSNKVFKSRLIILLDSLNYLCGTISAVEEKLIANSKRLVHNLTSLNGHMIQEIFSVMPQDRLAGNIRRSIPLIAAEMKGGRSQDFAKCFLSLAKHSTAMKNEFSVFKKIDSLEAGIERRTHSVHKVVMNVAYLFFSDFADKGGYVDVAESDLKISIDYECAFVALYHLFDNAAKYICPQTHLDVVISGSEKLVSIFLSMCSLGIAPSEIDKLVIEGFSGSIPLRLQLNGDGVGLSLVQKVMELHGGQLRVDAGQDSGFVRDGVEYKRNTFILDFPVV